MSERLIRDISDTARWMAVYRARESERPDALFHDPFARALAGPRGEAIARRIDAVSRDSWAYAMRVHLVDGVVAREVANGADMVLNLASGLDARPYRMDLPPALRWIEVDLPGISDYKARVLDGAVPRCRLERVVADLSQLGDRRALFARLSRDTRHALVLTEGLLIYLDPADVASLAADLAVCPPFRRWVTDLYSPGLLWMLRRTLGRALEEGDAPLKFGPAAGLRVLEPQGWHLVEAHSLLRAAAQRGRVPWWMRLVSRWPDPGAGFGRRPWAGVCLFERR